MAERDRYVWEALPVREQSELFAAQRTSETVFASARLRARTSFSYEQPNCFGALQFTSPTIASTQIRCFSITAYTVLQFCEQLAVSRHDKVKA